MNATADLAEQLLQRALAKGQSAMRCDDSTDVDALRKVVRKLALDRGVRIRTGMLDRVLVVIRVDAALWDQSAAVMREKLIAPSEPNVVS
ncbi:hypothetical protein [Allobranchiibius sp. GilTou73]|uniref:hypothetical protein n=1 Tax=Allobranchiibius sp. GilTou73 TaxID=2904523 RepID=UPI001F3EE8B4|nr:hypothetical protein [Allobranchiibius sp. GilTou73]UIJ35603.1 hypothetical protein LVQ62_04250 [Allobranchiibius sp. GilTou73]